MLPSRRLTERHDSTLIAYCVAASLAMHAMLMALLPGWRATKEDIPMPLTVEIVKPPELLEPPKPLPLSPEPPPKVKPKLEPPRAVEQQLTPQPKTILTVPPDTPAAAQAPVIPAPPPPAPMPTPAPAAEAKPAPPPVAESKPPPPAPVTPPRADAAYLNNPRPNYPLAAQRRGDQGTVLVRLTVTADGLARNVGLARSSGHPSLDAAALAAVAGWRFVPARQGTQAVDAPYEVPVVFKLD
jgi:protein TonB